MAVNDEAFDTSRRMFLCMSGGIAAVLAGAIRAPLAFAQTTTSSAMKIGVVGSGKLGGSVGGRWVKAGHEVFFSSRHPEELKGLVDSLGSRAHAGSVKDALAFGSIVFIAVPYAALPDIGRENAAGLAGKIVIDACNPIASRDGDIVKEAMANGIGPTSTKYLPGTRLVRAFNPVGYRNFEGEPQTAPSGERIGMPVAGDDPEAVKLASQLVRDAGLEPVVVPLARAMDFAPGTALFGKAIPVSELRKQLGVAQ
jgi:8-hydroxy-5-deazaflavin:NADPH oxidoreductase